MLFIEKVEFPAVDDPDADMGDEDAEALWAHLGGSRGGALPWEAISEPGKRMARYNPAPLFPGR